MGHLPINELVVGRNVIGFCEDGSANRQVYDLAKPLANDDYLTADWDHETDELSHWMNFLGVCHAAVCIGVWLGCDRLTAGRCTDGPATKTLECRYGV